MLKRSPTDLHQLYIHGSSGPNLSILLVAKALAGQAAESQIVESLYRKVLSTCLLIEMGKMGHVIFNKHEIILLMDETARME